MRGDDERDKLIPKIVAQGPMTSQVGSEVVLPGETRRPPRPPGDASPGVQFALRSVQPEAAAPPDDGGVDEHKGGDIENPLVERPYEGYGATRAIPSVPSVAAPRPSRGSIDSVGSQGRRVSFGKSPSDGGSLNDDSAQFTMTHAVATPSVPRRVMYTSPTRRMRSRRYEQVGSASGSVSRPDFDDCLRRSAAVLHKHVTVCDWRRRRATPDTQETGQFRESAAKLFEEAQYVSPQYEVTMYQLQLIWSGFQFSQRKLEPEYTTPTMRDIYEFLSTLFVKAHLSSECSIVCLIYVERLMEKANVPLLDSTWRPILLCSMLLASKVWQDCASWNIEFSVVYPQFSLAALNQLERNYVTAVGWDMYISQSLYAKYYFALRSLNEKDDFRRKYNRMMLDGGGNEQPKEGRAVE